MSETDSGAAGTQTAKAAQPQAGTDSPAQAAGAQNAQTAGAADGSGTDAAAIQRERDEARAAATAANAEAAKYRLQLKAIEDSQKASDAAKLSEAEKIAKRLKDLEDLNASLAAKAAEQVFRTSALEAATKVGFRSPELAARLIDRSKVELTEDGTPKNLESLLREVLKAEPYLGKASTTDFGGGNRGATPAGPTDMNRVIRHAAGRGPG